MKLRYVIDAKVLMSILISGKSQYINLLTLYEFMMPEFAFVELNLYQSVIKSSSKLDNIQFREYCYTIFSLISFFPSFVQNAKSVSSAVELCKDIDAKDTLYVSLAIDTNTRLLTHDIKLFKGLRKKGFKRIERFEDFLSAL